MVKNYERFQFRGFLHPQNKRNSPDVSNLAGCSKAQNGQASRKSALLVFPDTQKKSKVTEICNFGLSKLCQMYQEAFIFKMSKKPSFLVDSFGVR